MTTITSPEDYLINHSWKNEQELAFYARIPTFDQAVEFACRGQMPYGRHSHFTRQAKMNDCWTLNGCDRAAKRIKAHAHRVKATTDFHQLWLEVQAALTAGTPPHITPKGARKSVNVWDISLWLGSHLGGGRLPRFLYLHAGTKDGAERVLGRKLRAGDWLEVSEFPREWQMAPWHLETALCMLGKGAPLRRFRAGVPS